MTFSVLNRLLLDPAFARQALMWSRASGLTGRQARFRDMGGDDAPPLLHANPCLALAAARLLTNSVRFRIGHGKIAPERGDDRVSQRTPDSWNVARATEL